MGPVFRRIAINGGFTALLLGVVGFLFAELASIWLAGSPGTRSATGEPIATADPDGSFSGDLKVRVPLLMAVWGFAFVAAGEVLLHFWRGERKPVAKDTTQPDAEALLEELLRQADAAQEAGDRRQETVAGGDRGQETGVRAGAHGH